MCDQWTDFERPRLALGTQPVGKPEPAARNLPPHEAARERSRRFPPPSPHRACSKDDSHVRVAAGFAQRLADTGVPIALLTGRTVQAIDFKPSRSFSLLAYMCPSRCESSPSFPLPRPTSSSLAPSPPAIASPHSPRSLLLLFAREERDLHGEQEYFAKTQDALQNAHIETLWLVGQVTPGFCDLTLFIVQPYNVLV